MTPFKLKVNDGEITLLWSNWAMMRFCEMNGNMPISKLLTIYDGDVLTFRHVITMLQAASEAAGKVVDERTASDWIDAGGGLQNAGSQILKFVEYTISCLLPNLNEPKEKEQAEEKKS